MTNPMRDTPDDVKRCADVAFAHSERMWKNANMADGEKRRRAYRIEAETAQHIARAILELPRSEWRDRPPATDEIRSHAAAYGDGKSGMWAFQARKGKSWGEPMIVWVDESDPPMWSSDAVRTRCRPTTDDGTPVPWPAKEEDR